MNGRKHKLVSLYVYCFFYFVEHKIRGLHTINIVDTDPSQQELNDPSQQELNDPSQQELNDPSQQELNDPSQQELNDPSQQELNDPSQQELNDRELNACLTLYCVSQIHIFSFASYNQ